MSGLSAAAALPVAPVGSSRGGSRKVLPGFNLTLGYTVLYLSLIVLIPLAGLLLRAATADPAEALALAFAPRTLAALRLSFGAAFLAALVNAVFGLMIAWLLVRHNFPGKRLVDAAIDLPFALPTAVAGIALSTIYAQNAWIGWLVSADGPLHLGWKIAYTPSGIVIALIFIGLPFVVRTVQPVLEEFEQELEEAAATLGANRWQTITRVILPRLLPAILTGFALAFARAVGEYGSVIFIASNLPNQSEIAPLLIIIKLEEFDIPGAAVIATIMLLLAFVMLLVINLIQTWARRRYGDV
jgi:sulfate transport system permease protein